jgi:geranylgeranyl pyrophosphate synthase
MERSGVELPTSVALPELEAVSAKLRSLLDGLSADGPLDALRDRYVQPAVSHLFRRQGKLLRPLLVILSARAAGAVNGSDALIHTAAAVELIHTASLAHDDMIDSSRERRGAPSLHVAHGTTTAILVGDLFYARFFQELSVIPGASPTVRLRLLSAFLQVTRAMCEGEILADQARIDRATLSFDAYIHVAQSKTAALISACCLAGGVLSGAAEPVIASLAGYGAALGLLFQIADDLADGDVPPGESPALAARAEECRSSCERCLDGLPASAAATELRALPFRILSPSGSNTP